MKELHITIWNPEEKSKDADHCHLITTFDQGIWFDEIDTVIHEIIGELE